MAASTTSLHLEAARQQAINLIFDEFQKVPETAMEITDFKSVGRNWVAVLKNEQFPDVLMIVEYVAPREGVTPGSYLTHLYERRTRASHVTYDKPLFTL